jgi:hypothetical protein
MDCLDYHVGCFPSEDDTEGCFAFKEKPRISLERAKELEEMVKLWAAVSDKARVLLVQADVKKMTPSEQELVLAVMQRINNEGGKR